MSQQYMHPSFHTHFTIQNLWQRKHFCQEQFHRMAQHQLPWRKRCGAHCQDAVRGKRWPCWAPTQGRLGREGIKICLENVWIVTTTIWDWPKDHVSIYIYISILLVPPKKRMPGGHLTWFILWALAVAQIGGTPWNQDEPSGRPWAKVRELWKSVCATGVRPSGKNVPGKKRAAWPMAPSDGLSACLRETPTSF